MILKSFFLISSEDDNLTICNIFPNTTNVNLDWNFKPLGVRRSLIITIYPLSSKLMTIQSRAVYHQSKNINFQAAQEQKYHQGQAGVRGHRSMWTGTTKPFWDLSVFPVWTDRPRFPLRVVTSWVGCSAETNICFGCKSQGGIKKIIKLCHVTFWSGSKLIRNQRQHPIHFKSGYDSHHKIISIKQLTVDKKVRLHTPIEKYEITQ